MFADDTEYHCIGNSIDKVTNAIQNDLSEIHSWRRNNVTIHPDKTEIMFISPTKFVGPIQSVRLGDNFIEVVKESDCLGVTINDRISWSTQVKKTASNLKK